EATQLCLCLLLSFSLLVVSVSLGQKFGSFSSWMLGGFCCRCGGSVERKNHVVNFHNWYGRSTSQIGIHGKQGETYRKSLVGYTRRCCFCSLSVRVLGFVLSSLLFLLPASGFRGTDTTPNAHHLANNRVTTYYDRRKNVTTNRSFNTDTHTIHLPCVFSLPQPCDPLALRLYSLPNPPLTLAIVVVASKRCDHVSIQNNEVWNGGSTAAGIF
ncbi:unnamed protein product, partial [Ectocarpus sp. 12 AP-2014]